jgi:hypothetical protein
LDLAVSGAMAGQKRALLMSTPGVWRNSAFQS